MDTLMQRENERDRLTLPGYRTDDDGSCSVMVHEVNNRWAPYAHSASWLSVRVEKVEAVRVADAILAGTP